MVNSLLIILLLGASSSCTKQGGKFASISAGSDTLVIAISQEAFILEKGQKTVSIPLKTVARTPLNSSKPLRLLFENIRVVTSGEGVYEVYINRAKQGSDELNIDKLLTENLIGTLNLYNLTIPNSPPIVSMKVPDRLVDLVISDEPRLSNLSILVVFRGNIMHDQTEVVHNGQVYFGKVSIVQ